MKKIIYYIVIIPTTIIVYLTFWYINKDTIIKSSQKDMETILFYFSTHWKYLLAGLIAGFLMWLFLKAIKLHVQNISEKLIEKVKKKYKEDEIKHKDFLESFKIHVIYSAITNRLVRDYILSNVTKKTLEDYLFENKYYLDELQRYGFPDDIIQDLKIKYQELKLDYLKRKRKKKKNEHNPNNK